MITTTLNKIREYSPCIDGWEKLLKHLGKTKADDEEFPLSVLLESNNLDDCLWALRSRPDLSSLWRLYAVDCARQVQHLMTDERSINALDVAERHANGQATDEELSAARPAAGAAAGAAARPAAWDAARAAALANAGGAVRSAAWAAARLQTQMLRETLNTGKRPTWPTPTK